MKDLTSATIGSKVVVKDLAKESSYRKRLLDMGVTPGVTMQIIGKAPLGDPIEVAVRGYKLVLRKSEASAILL
ncbi:ferrous iron transport protein A [Paenibacillus albiflavus]|uniref:Ferrous iron transport protein A n=1 Tax=Paenibacillus albiflavus TaxID=2545760 RepID=A0A4R4EKB5_9BACL|nr:ferrous iron transport protein A [Paenibacillus albiflavus]TCZ78718.1 ferrous iron transport protein A [Paenibacillus albiflavus]